MHFSAILTSFALVFTLCGPTVAHAQSLAATDTALLDMAQAYKARDLKKLATLLPQFNAHPLESWAAYWELSTRLPQASDAEVQAFLSRYAGTYLEDRLRAEWLLVLGKNSNWAVFQQQLALYRMQDEKSVHCYAALAKHLAGGADQAATIQNLWLGQKDADEACASAAEQLFKDQPRTRHMAWLRARLGMEHDRLRVVTQAVDLVSPGHSALVNQIYLHPSKYLNHKLTAVQTSTRELVSLALIRLATIDPAEAAAEMGNLRWKAQLSAEERSWIWGAIGKRAAQRHMPEAQTYFAQGLIHHMHEDHLAWWARAALRAGHWRQVQDTIQAMPATLRKDPAWIYWLARALRKQTSSESAQAQAQQLLQDLASTRGFYEMLAAEDLGQAIVAPPPPEPLTAAEKEQAKSNPGLLRALYAIHIGLRPEGVREWNYTTNLHTQGGMDDRSLLAAADLACQHGVWDRCINTSERTRSVFDAEQRFPMPFRDAMLQQTQAIGLDPAYVYGLIRQESRFVMDAKSSVGAAGLMQVMPATARWTAKKIGLTQFKLHHISDRDTNLAIGTNYLKLVLDSFDGAMPLAAAAYNAGPGRPRLWRGQEGAPTVEAAIWAENIPFNETRDYVKKVLSNTTLYASLISGKAQSLKARLGTVGPKDAAIPEKGLDLP
jgi:soluble lytic murein transglycosylase